MINISKPFTTKKSLYKNKQENVAILINKVNQFKLDNPPTFYISDRQDIIHYEDRSYYRPYDRPGYKCYDDYEEKIKCIPIREIHMSIILPLKVPLNISPFNFHDYDDNGNICIGFIFEIESDAQVEIKKCKTKKCLIKIPECYFYFTEECIKDFKNIKKTLMDNFEIPHPPILKYLKDYNKNERYNARIDCMIKGLQKYNYFYDIYGNEIQYDRDY